MACDLRESTHVATDNLFMKLCYSIHGQDHFGQRPFFKGQISGERSQDQWSSGCRYQESSSDNGSHVSNYRKIIRVVLGLFDSLRLAKSRHFDKLCNLQKYSCVQIILIGHGGGGVGGTWVLKRFLFPI